MPVDFLESAVFMSPLASLSELAERVFVKRSTVLGLEEIVGLELLFSQLVNDVELIVPMRILALGSICTRAGLGPVLADVALVLLVNANACH